MELKRQLFRQNLLRSRAFTQITLDDDCIVKDNKPDLLNIIHTRGSVIFEDVKVTARRCGLPDSCVLSCYTAVKITGWNLLRTV